MKPIKSQLKKSNMAKSNNGKGQGKPSSTTSGVEYPLVLTSGVLIEGTFRVDRIGLNDILTGNITNWQGVWHDYHYNYAPPIYQIVPGGQGATNYYANLPEPAMPFIVVVPHGGVERSYFFGVSSNGGHNVAGKTITVS